jgi:hypothetical protein
LCCGIAAIITDADSARDAGANSLEWCSPLRLERLPRAASLWLSTLTGQSQMTDVGHQHLSLSGRLRLSEGKTRFMRTLSLVLILILANYAPAQTTRSTQPLRSLFLKDVDGDGRADKFVYTVKPWRTEYEGSLTIRSAKGSVLWQHQWLMMKDKLFGDLLNLEGNISLETWVEKFFAGKLTYGATFRHVKLKASDLKDEERLAAFAKYYGVSLGKLKRDILSQEVNIVFAYRAEWREDLNKLVYVPTIRKFVCYQRGY